MRGQPGFFDVEDRLRGPSDRSDHLEAFAAAVDFELLRPALDAVLRAAGYVAMSGRIVEATLMAALRRNRRAILPMCYGTPVTTPGDVASAAPLIKDAIAAGRPNPAGSGSNRSAKCRDQTFSINERDCEPHITFVLILLSIVLKFFHCV